MREITYSKERENQYVAQDAFHKGVRYVIVGGGNHPCAYVQCTPEFLEKHIKQLDYIPEIHVHGSVTWVGPISKIYALQSYEGDWFGWDYGHAADWSGMYTDEQNIMFHNHKYDLETIEEECKSAVEQYLKIQEDDYKHNHSSEAPLTKEMLKELGFVSIFDGLPNDDMGQMFIKGGDGDKKWKVHIDFKNPNQCYIINQNPKKKYEGSILTLEDLATAVKLCKIPITV